MDNNIFKKSAKIVISQIYNNTDITKISSNDFNIVRDFMHDHPNDNDVITFKNALATLYAKQFKNVNLINALSMPNKLIYFKKQQVLQNLPFILTQNFYPSYLYQLFCLPSDCLGGIETFYKPVFWFIKSVDSSLISEDIINAINSFVTNNKIIINSNKDNYDSYKNEINYYKNATKNIFNSDDFNDFSITQSTQGMFSESKIKLMYINKKLGNIGELIIYNFIKNFKNACFVAKDLGNGFGYDLYFQIQAVDTIECLVEVKTTKSMTDNDYFYLSENEYNTMLNTLNNENIKYIICRVNINNTSILEYYLLEFVDSHTLRSANYDQDHVEYYLEPNDNNTYCFIKKEYSKKL